MSVLYWGFCFNLTLGWTLKKEVNINNFLYTGCPGGNVPDFGRMFLKIKYTDITKHTYI